MPLVAWKLRSFAFFLLCALLSGCTEPKVAASQSADNHEAVFPRDKVSEVRYEGYERSSYYVPMTDGTRLALTIYKPRVGGETSELPVLLWYMPGHRESIDLETGEITTAWSAEDLDFFTSRGYIVAAAEMRGSGASFGHREVGRTPQIGRDGKDLVDWIAKQPWSNGAVGMVGASYQGFSQYATAAERPQALKAIFPEIAGFDDYTSMFYPGGILNVALSQFAAAAIAKDDQNYYEPQARRVRLPAVPVVDEDGDGELVDEIPIDKDGDGSFLNDGEPEYRDGAEREHIYYRATKDHVENNYLTVEKLRAAPFRDSKLAGTEIRYSDIDPSTRPARIAGSSIAVYNRGGWFDYHARDTVMWHASLAGLTPTRLMMVPTGHGHLPREGADALYEAGPYIAHFGVEERRADKNFEKLRFFDHYVKGIDNGFEDEPPVLLYVMGEGWRREAAWPLEREEPKSLHFTEGGQLAESPSAGVDEYKVDLSADSRSDGANRWNYRISGAENVLKSGNGQRLTYTTEVLEHGVEVTGHPVVSIEMSANTAGADLFVYLEDVTPEGNALLVTEGQLRANYVEQLPGQEMLGEHENNPSVKPDLPWHGFDEGHYQEQVFANGEARTLVVDLMPTAWVFKKGHRIRVSIAGADAPSFELHPDYAGEDEVVFKIHRGEASKVVLPVIPRDR